ncbi:MAG: hydantoinase/oxoprolinase family protein [Steroidobacteraceae bacterium]|jgi:N-methylhydantoinase A|nr:hydantoinase/oxoprolinase family protein [Steroidobacteraceae bacterium]
MSHAAARAKDADWVPEDGLKGYSIGVDIGGTFTDCAVVSPAGEVHTGKAPTTPDDRSRGFFEAINVVADRLGLPLRDLLAQTERIVHGTTTGTNAIVARHGARLGLITTAGHGDVMYLMRGSGRTSGLPADELLDVPSTNKPEPLVPKRLIIEIAERIDVDGEVVVDLDEDAVRAAARSLRDAGVEAVCISFLWSIKNPSHERRAREIVNEETPDLYVSCASDLVARLGEYERTTAGLMNAYIGPLMLRYVSSIEQGARERGFKRDVLFAQCAGGAITGDEARAAPIRTVQSGPVAGIVSSVFWAQQVGYRNLIAADMGGTTFDVSVIRDRQPLERDLSVFQRYELALPMLDVESIGAGGGSIAWIDASGRLNVGPQSAGADPGPACYGRGEAATVTDADVVLGVLDPERFLGGRMPLDPERALQAVRRIGEPLGLDPYQTAAGIVRIVDSRMADLIRRMSVLRGFDPREFACLAFGGGGPVHCAAVAREAGMRQMIVPLPRMAAVWSAFGAAACDVIHVYQRAELIDLPVDSERILGPFGALESQAWAQLAQEGFAGDRIMLRRTLRMKYAMQVHDVEVPVPEGLHGAAACEVLIQEFERMYERLFGEGSGYREGGVQVTSFQVRATGHTTKPRLVTGQETGWPDECERLVYWQEYGRLEPTRVLRAEGEVRFDRLEGPALIELPDTVIVVRPGQSVRVDDYGNVVVDLPARG